MNLNPDSLTMKNIARWYRKAGVPFVESDWGPRSETGESAGPQRDLDPRRDVTTPHESTPDRMWWWEKREFIWRRRTPSDQEWVEMLDDFFAPYLALLSRPKGNLVWQVYNGLFTYRQVAKEEWLRSRSSAHEAVFRAVQDLTRLIANDDPLFPPQPDGRRRDFEAERHAASRVLAAYLERRQHGTD